MPLTLTLESRALPARDLRVRRAVLREAISRPYELHLDVVLLDPAGFDLDAAIGEELDLVLLDEGAELRRVHGMIAEIDDLADPEADHRSYRLRVVPRMHRLTLVTLQEVHMNVSVPDLFTEKLTSVGLADSVELRLASEHGPRELLVQYREDGLAFVSRLTENEGLSFFFEDRDGRDVVVLTDHGGGFADLGTAPFHGGGARRHVFQLEVKRRAVPGAHIVRDYNYRLPTLDLTAVGEVNGGLAGAVVEQGHHRTPAEAERLARIRAEEVSCRSQVYTGRSALPGLQAGGRITLQGHPRFGELNLLMTSVEHSAVQALGITGGDKEEYSNVFTAVPAERPFRPERVTPRPKMAGLLHGAIMPAPHGDPSFAQLDDQGRYLVRFLFDLWADGKRAASPRLRMAQAHAGAGFGMHMPLKPGTEVVIAFVDGDPDRPLIVGAVPNPITPSPVDGSSPYTHRIRTQTGIVFDLVDGR